MRQVHGERWGGGGGGGGDRRDSRRDAGSDWIHSHMPEWILQALDSWPSGWGADPWQDAAYQQDLKNWKTIKEALKKMPVSRENYESAVLDEAERDGFHAASAVMISQDRALMLFAREENGRIYLDLPGGKRACIAEDPWSCARREVLEERRQGKTMHDSTCLCSLGGYDQTSGVRI